MIGPVRGISAAMVNDVLTVLHGNQLGPEIPYLQSTFTPPDTDDPHKILCAFAKHVGAQRFDKAAEAVAACLKQHDPDDIDVLVAIVPLADAIERTHDTIRKLAYRSYEYLCAVEKKAVPPLERNILLLQAADTDAKRVAAWHALRTDIENFQIIPFLEKVNSFLYSAGYKSRKRCVIFGARPDCGEGTEHFKLVLEFLHNISNGFVPFTLKTPLLKETLEQFLEDVPDADSFDTAMEDLTKCVSKWYKAYELGVLTLHRYFVIDLLERTCRQKLDPAIRILAQAAAASSPSALQQVRSTLEARLAGRDYASPFFAQSNELRELIRRIADWHDRFATRTSGSAENLIQARLLIESASVAASALYSIAESIPTGNEEADDQFNVRRFYVQLGRFNAVLKKTLGFDGWDPYVEAHMKLPY